MKLFLVPSAWIKCSLPDVFEQEVLERSTLWKIRSFFMGAGYDPIIGTEQDYLGSNWLCRYWAFLTLTHMTYEVRRDLAALQRITHIFSTASSLGKKGVWLWWVDQVCALVRRGCCCFSWAHQGVTVLLIYGLLLKQCSLSPTHYKFTFTYITSCISHTNFQKRKEEANGLSCAQK